MHGRNHFQFPPEDAMISVIPATQSEREDRLATLSKALICLGDIARYRELYNESNGRPRAGHDDMTTPRRGRNKRGGAPELPIRPRNYDKAQQCYEQARLLVPYEGNPSHQLAILASYQKDSFASLIHYYRALCVRQPYDTAAENLNTVLTKALEVWRQRMRRERDKSGANDSSLPPRARVELFKERVVVLHALWRVGMEKGLEKMRSISPKHNEKVSHDFYALISDRHLPIDMISNTIVLSHGALWKHRMIRDTSTSSHHRKTETVPPAPGTASIIEWNLLDHLLDLHFALLEVGKEELKDPPPMDATDDLAQRISATFRRTLPALRIASKWLNANFKYVAQDQEFVAFQEKERAKGLEISKRWSEKISGYSTKTKRFWETYADFMRSLSRAFPAQKLPKFDAPLEEDIEMRGFLPLRNLMGEKKDSEKNLADGHAREQVHPNVEQLMRISDLLDDAKALAEMENSPISIMNNVITFKFGIVEDVRPPSHPEMTQNAGDNAVPIRQQQLLANIRDNSLNLHPIRDPDGDDMTELTSRTDDDPVRAAFDHLNKAENLIDDEEVEEDEVVYMRSSFSSLSPTLSPVLHATPVTPVKPMLSPKNVSPRSPTHYQPVKIPPFNLPAAAPPAPVTTAEDLLKRLESTAPQPKFLFGNELSHRPTQSIWSASRDEQPLSLPARNGASFDAVGGPVAAPSAVGHIYQTSNHQISGSLGTQDLSQPSIWSSSYPSQSSQNSQHNLVGALPSAPFAQPPQSIIGSGLAHSHHHQRNPSASVAAQLFPTQAQIQHDPFAYSSTIQQPPIHRPDPTLSPSSAYLSSAVGHSPALGALSSSQVQYYTATNPGVGYHTRHLSIPDPRLAQQSYLPPAAMSQVWGNTG
ncbi:hypothetical protein NLJ89_g6337 [Agrocybe chaxingu]|uniref:DNA/RNA-binding domain-containing protein n=1 Tax=Agrocybe chaxingu TaxID=84603 RepID=A0A9W8JYY6_9AGAR|nr:hypothetical protein NLJ89_g6337 [Agrocybe chaxingu]